MLAPIAALLFAGVAVQHQDLFDPLAAERRKLPLAELARAVDREAGGRVAVDQARTRRAADGQRGDGQKPEGSKRNARPLVFQSEVGGLG